MRCLYCGKELALFKRLTGGGEFCSDAHRQKYQEEYNQLALSRLLQASPAAEGAGKNALGKANGQDRGTLEVAPDIAVGELEVGVHEAPVSVGRGSNGSGTGGSGATNGTGGNNGSYRFQGHDRDDYDLDKPA